MFSELIITWQRAHGRHDLPWQGTRDAYRIWLAEVMLQQTQVATVIPYYRRFVAAIPERRGAGRGWRRRGHVRLGGTRLLLASAQPASMCASDRRRTWRAVPAVRRGTRAAAGHRPVDRGRDRSVCLRRAGRDPGRQRQARAGAPLWCRRLSGGVDGGARAVGHRRGAASHSDDRRLYPGPDGPGIDRLHAQPARLHALPGAARPALRGARSASRNCRHRGRRRRDR